MEESRRKAFRLALDLSVFCQATRQVDYLSPHRIPVLVHHFSSIKYPRVSSLAELEGSLWVVYCARFVLAGSQDMWQTASASEAESLVITKALRSY